MKLFNRHGFNGVGIDQIIAEAGVAKTTLYRHYATKNHLIVAVLRYVGENFREQTRQRVDALASDPKDKLTAVFDVLAEWFGDESFYGCPFLSATSEFSERESLIFQEAVLHKRLTQAYFEELARAADMVSPVQFAKEMSLLYEGATNMANVMGTVEPAEWAKNLLSQMIKCSGQKNGV